ncbi:DUF2871 domain-containing protein [Georgenia sp. H159]|uniref:DUF2871 domain-containing protein n=1 Tax=Georgenia sp. H159 TaxID=3076115 RepID=UPI002D787317|nr:DUF2871 domain-containing protein [Georgenia sp. H159]
MRTLYLAAATYAALGLASGLVYREVTKANGFTGDTQLAVMHTHLLALGFLVMLIVLALDATLDISGTRSFTWFFITYNAGLVLTAVIMAWHGVLQVNGEHDVTAAIPGLAGLGHTLLTVGIVCLLVALRQPVRDAIGRRAVARDVPRVEHHVEA